MKKSKASENWQRLHLLTIRNRLFRMPAQLLRPEGRPLPTFYGFIKDRFLIFTSHFSTNAIDIIRNVWDNFKNSGTLEFLGFCNEKWVGKKGPFPGNIAFLPADRVVVLCALWFIDRKQFFIFSPNLWKGRHGRPCNRYARLLKNICPKCLSRNLFLGFFLHGSAPPSLFSSSFFSPVNLRSPLLRSIIYRLVFPFRGSKRFICLEPLHKNS